MCVCVCFLIYKNFLSVCVFSSDFFFFYIQYVFEYACVVDCVHAYSFTYT